MVKRRILHQRAKFREDRSIRNCNIAIFVTFKMAAAAILDFQKFLRGIICDIVPNFIKISQNFCGHIVI